MSARFIIREPWHGLVIPRPDLGLHGSRIAAKKAARHHGMPTELIHQVRRPT